MLRRWISFWFAIAWVFWLTGCTGSQIQIWGNSDVNRPQEYILRGLHPVHAGKTINFRILVQPDTATYILVKFGDEYELASRLDKGEYAFSKELDSSWRDQTINIIVKAYHQEGRPDFYMENGRIKERKNINEPTDMETGSSTTQVRCYQSVVKVSFTTQNRKEPDWTKAQMKIHGHDNKITVVRQGRAGVEGFTALGCDAWGTWTVFYEPKWDEICVGKTYVEFIVPDPTSGKEIKKDYWIDTP
jgi:hypothetical protein